MRSAAIVGQWDGHIPCELKYLPILQLGTLDAVEGGVHPIALPPTAGMKACDGCRVLRMEMAIHLNQRIHYVSRRTFRRSGYRSGILV